MVSYVETRRENRKIAIEPGRRRVDGREKDMDRVVSDRKEAKGRDVSDGRLPLDPPSSNDDKVLPLSLELERRRPLEDSPPSFFLRGVDFLGEAPLEGEGSASEVERKEGESSVGGEKEMSVDGC